LTEEAIRQDFAKYIKAVRKIKHQH
jgi:hypothetical protein